MNITSRILQLALHLDPPLTRDLVVRKDLEVPMPDGVVLLADHWAPRNPAADLPTALIRTPYGRGGLGTLLGRSLAERGFQVLVQSVRGTFGSGGSFDPMRQEREDGLATLDWVIRQPWFGGSIVLTGLSYLGYVQLALGDRLPPEVKALVTMVTESALTLEFLRTDGTSLETPFGWGVLVGTQESRWALPRQLVQGRKNTKALYGLPLGQADQAAIGERSDYIQDILAHDATSERWKGIDHRDLVAQIGVPVSSLGGWYDIFLPGQLRDFQVLQDGRLIVGPWTHNSRQGMAAMIRETLDFGLPLAGGEEPPARPKVRLRVMGEDKWRSFESWPPPGYVPTRYHLQSGGALSEELPADSAGDRFRYDPADPTPAAGGVRMVGDAGRVDNAALEARADVLTYTTDVLDADVEVVGEVSAEVWFRSSLPYADVFVRLCDVDEKGRSFNVCDGLTSLAGADEVTCATVRLWPTAYRFKRGHRIRVQVSSGAFPRYARNAGTGEPPATAITLRAADQQVFHDPDHASAIVLPVAAG